MITRDDTVTINIYRNGSIEMWRSFSSWPMWMYHKTITESSWNRLWYVLSKWDTTISGSYCIRTTKEKPSPEKKHYLSITFKNPNGTQVFHKGNWVKESELEDETNN